MARITAFDTADQGIGVAALDGQGADDRLVRAHDGAGGFWVDALAADEAQVLFDIVAVARIVFRVDQFEIDIRAHAKAVALEARFDDLRTADKDRLGRILLQQNLGGAQHALVLAFGKDHALLLGLLRGGEDRLHDEAGAPDETVELVEIGVEIGDRAQRHPGLGRRAGNGRRDAQDEALVEG